MLNVQHIDASYGSKQVLFDTSISVHDGEYVLLVGPNGAGKSTLLKVIANLVYKSKGEIYFLENEISKWQTIKRIKSGIGYLLQSENIVPGFTVEENLLLGGYSLNRNIRRRRKDELLELFEFLKSKIHMRAGILSGGERQALAICMVLMRYPRLLLLDEPLAGLSPKTASEILGYIQKAHETLGIRSICMVEHNLKISLQWASKIVVLVDGRVIHSSHNPQKYLDHTEELEKFFFGETKNKIPNIS